MHLAFVKYVNVERYVGLQEQIDSENLFNDL